MLLDAPQEIRVNTANLDKLSRYIEAEKVDLSKLKSSLSNSRNPQKWIDLKLTQKELDDLYVNFRDDPPFDFTPWTPDHKAQRWNNYKEGCANGQNNCLDFESWSNGYDGKIDLVTGSGRGVDEYFDQLGWVCPTPPCRERLIPDITGILDGQVITAGRRLDIVDIQAKRAIEFKEYSSGKVYNSIDIRKEVALDKALLLSGQMDNIEWVFKGCTPSGPLEKALKEANISIKLES